MAEQKSDRDNAISTLLAELRRQGIRDERVLAAIGRVPRERFVPERSRDQAWANVALPIGAGSANALPGMVVSGMASKVRAAATPAMVETRRRAVGCLVTWFPRVAVCAPI